MKNFFIEHKKIIIFEFVIFCIAIAFQLFFVKENKLLDQNIGCAYFECEIVSSTIHASILLSGYSTSSYVFNFPKAEQFDVNGIEADIDSDGEREQILNICENGSNHCPQYGVIVKSGRVIFSTENVGISRIKPADNGGFYVEWIDLDRQMPSFCCPTGHNSTKFEIGSGVFMPIQEIEVFYTRLNIN
ncbi:MAG: hypothetical protein AB1333_00235 [Patescibacteria group bacterium]